MTIMAEKIVDTVMDLAQETQYTIHKWCEKLGFALNPRKTGLTTSCEPLNNEAWWIGD